MNQGALFIENFTFFVLLQPVRLLRILEEKFLFESSYLSHLPSTNHGGVHTYRLGERLNGIQEVSGSIPLISTKTKSLENTMFSRLFFFACGAKATGTSSLRPASMPRLPCRTVAARRAGLSRFLLIAFALLSRALHYFLSGFSGSIRCVERYSRGETPWTFLKAREKCSWLS